MFNWRSHPEEGQLLRFCEGELPAREVSRIEDHIRGCWECRTHIDDVRSIISDYIHYRSDVLLPGMPPPPAPWTSLGREFQRIRNEQASDGRFKVFRRPLPWILAGLAALVAATAAVVLIKPDSHPAPPRSEIHERKSAEAVEYRASQPAPKRSVPSPKNTPVPEERVGPDNELKVIAALHRIGADLGDPVEVTRRPNTIVVSGAGLEPERVAQLRASVATIPHVSFDFAAPAPPPTDASPAVVESGRSSPMHAEIARQFTDRAAFQNFVDQTLEASEEMLARAHALRSLADRFPPNIESQMSAGGITLLASIRNEHAAALASSVIGIDRSVAPVLRSLRATANSHPSSAEANWQAAGGTLLSTAERVDQLIGTMFTTTTGSSLDSLSASALAAQLADVLGEIKAEVASFQRLSVDDQTRGGR